MRQTCHGAMGEITRSRGSKTLLACEAIGGGHDLLALSGISRTATHLQGHGMDRTKGVAVEQQVVMISELSETG